MLSEALHEPRFNRKDALNVLRHAENGVHEVSQRSSACAASGIEAMRVSSSPSQVHDPVT